MGAIQLFALDECRAESRGNDQVRDLLRDQGYRKAAEFGGHDQTCEDDHRPELDELGRRARDCGPANAVGRSLAEILLRLGAHLEAAEMTPRLIETSPSANGERKRSGTERTATHA